MVFVWTCIWNEIRKNIYVVLIYNDFTFWIFLDIVLVMLETTTWNTQIDTFCGRVMHQLTDLWDFNIKRSSSFSVLSWSPQECPWRHPIASLPVYPPRPQHLLLRCGPHHVTCIIAALLSLRRALLHTRKLYRILYYLISTCFASTRDGLYSIMQTRSYCLSTTNELYSVMQTRHLYYIL